MAENIVSQKIVLDGREYIQTLKAVNAEVKSTTAQANKDFTEHSKVIAQNEKQIKTWANAFKNEMVEAGKSMRDNVLTGLKAMTLGAGTMAFKKGIEDATVSLFSFSKAFAEIKSKSNASASELDKWQNSLRSIATKTTANVDSIAESFNMLFNEVGNKDELLDIMGSLGNAAAMGNGNAAQMAAQVQQAMHNEGKSMTKANVDEYLNATNVLRRNAVGVNNLENASGVLSGINTKGTGLNMRQIANFMSAATAASGNAAGVDAVKSLITNDLEKSVRLSAALGLKQNKQGQLDLSSLGSSEYAKKVMGLGSNDQQRLLSIKSITGASDDAAQAFLDIAKKSGVFGQALDKASHDTEKFEDSAEKAKDNLENAYKGMMNSITEQLSYIIKPLEGPIKSVMNAVKGSPLLMGAAGLATAGIGGALIRSLGKSVFGKLPGMGLASGVAEGKALEQAGVQPVFVVNASEIGGGGIAGAAGSMGGFLGKAGLVGLAAGAGVGVGSYINDKLDENADTNKFGQKFTLAEKAMAKVIPEWAGGMSSQQYKENYTAVKIEIDTKDPMFTAKPKATDNQRSGSVH